MFFCGKFLFLLPTNFPIQKSVNSVTTLTKVANEFGEWRDLIETSLAIQH